MDCVGLESLNCCPGRDLRQLLVQHCPLADKEVEALTYGKMIDPRLLSS